MQLYTDESPLAGIAHTDFIELVFRLGVRPERPDVDEVPRLTDPLWNLAEQCWIHKAKERPIIAKIHDTIVDIMSQIPEDTFMEFQPNTIQRHEQEGPTAGVDNIGDIIPQILEETSEAQTIVENVREMLGRSEAELEQVAARLNSNLLEKQRNLGEDHPQTLTTMASLASAYRKLKQLDQAEKLGAVTVDKMKNILGADHPATLLTMGHLALVYSGLAQYQAAADLQKVVIKKQEKILGKNHRDTLVTSSNLIRVYRKLGRLKEAEELALVTIQKWKEVAKHPQGTVWTMSMLADTYRKMGKMTEAQEISDAVVKIEMAKVSNHRSTCRQATNDPGSPKVRRNYEVS
jgi:tetratricopeptide (TPR) repeat protein